MIETSSEFPQKTLVIFANFRKFSEINGHSRNIFGNVCLAFGQLLENLRNSSESVWKYPKNRVRRH